MLSSDRRAGTNMGASGSNCNEDEMTKDLSRNRAYCAARESGRKAEFVHRMEEAWRRARVQDARLQDEWVVLERDEKPGKDRSVMG